MNYKIAMVDLDGTLLDGRSKINKSNLSALKKYKEKGGEIIIATGRWPISALIFNQVIEKYNKQPNKYLVALNGSLIYGDDKTKPIFDKPIDGNISKSIIDNILTNFKIPMLIYSKEGIESKVIHSSNFPFKWLISRFNCGKIINYNNSEITIYKFIMFSLSSNKIDKMYLWLNENFGDELQIIRTTKLAIEITHKDVSKGSALQYLANLTKNRNEDFVAFGDSGNDVVMFEKSGFRISLSGKNENLVNESNVVLKHKNGIKNGLEKYIFNDYIFNDDFILNLDFSKVFFSIIERFDFIKNLFFWNYLIKQRPLVLMSKYSLKDNLSMFKSILDTNKNVLIFSGNGRSIYSYKSKKIIKKILISELQIVLLKDFLIESLNNINVYIIINCLNGKNLFLTKNLNHFVNFIANSNFNEDDFHVPDSNFEKYFNAKKVEYTNVSIIGLEKIPKNIKVDSLEIVTNGIITTISNKQTLFDDADEYIKDFFSTQNVKKININDVLNSNNKIFDCVDLTIKNNFLKKENM